MLAILMATAVAAGEPARFIRHDIDQFPAGYQVAVADLGGDARPDVIALSTEADRVDWYENPSWKRRAVARTPRNIDLAVRDVDGDGRLDVALASGFYFDQSRRGGQIQWLRQPDEPEATWPLFPIAVDPVTHRIRWADVDGDGRPELVHAPLFGPGSDGAKAPTPAHLWAFRVPERPETEPWKPIRIDETLTVLHGIWVGDLDGDRRDEIYTASFEGICRFDFEGTAEGGNWRKVHLSPGAPPADEKPGTSRGTSEVVPGRFGPRHEFVAAIEPWHGNQAVIYQASGADGWQRRVIDDSLSEGHALLAADFDGDGAEEIVAGWRGAGGGLRLYDPSDAEGAHFKVVKIDDKMPAEGAVAVDINGDGRLDLVVIGGRANALAWYENAGR